MDKEQNTILHEIKVGDKVITRDGKSGQVVEIYDGSADRTSTIYIIKYEDGTSVRAYIREKSFYLIGKNFFGNKAPIEELTDRIADVHAEIERLKAEETQLRKQRWRLEYQMNGEWKPQNRDKAQEVEKEIEDE